MKPLAIRRLVIRATLALLAVAAGCRRADVAGVKDQELANPEIEAAWAASTNEDLAAVEARYEAIIRKKPDLARAHLDFAMILMNAEEKPLSAIYHFMRYLELRPESEKRELIGRNIRTLTGLLGNKAARARQTQLEQQVAALQAENERLRVYAAAGTPAPAAPAARPAGPGPAAAGFRLYTVQAGDSLTRIAQRIYGDGDRAAAIFQANRGKLRSPNDLYAGQVLVIPP
ncbi:MAG: LysM peptidoglycan-binding domain-containing protein [Kiritimatiellia bacterium]